MVSSQASSVEQYLAELEPSRRHEIQTVRTWLLERLPEGLEEQMNWGMISYQVPLSRFPNTYNDQPLLFAALASQKHKISLYLMSIYAFEDKREKFESDWQASGKKFDVGKSCIRFRTVADIPADIVKEAIGAVSVEQYLEQYQLLREKRREAK